MTEQEYWTVPEASKTLRCSEKAIIRLIQSREIRASYFAQRWIIPRDEIVRILNKNANTLRSPFGE